jgi:predicted methyltransferase
LKKREFSPNANAEGLFIARWIRSAMSSGTAIRHFVVIPMSEQQYHRNSYSGIPMKKLFAPLVFAFFVSACGQPTADSNGGTSAPADHSAAADIDVAVYADALANPARPDADRERDAGRKPAEVLEFFGIAPEMAVLDMFSGGGYYTEIMSYVVGDQGTVVAQSNKPYLNYVGEEFELRHADNRLVNVDVLMAENNELLLEANQFDAVIMILSYHDIYHENPSIEWHLIDGPVFLAEIMKSLKPGGIVGIVDHAAAAGAPSETGGTIHRIDPALVIAEMQAAGFELEARSDILRNAGDDHQKSVFGPDIRGKTDRFVLRFRKPH